MTWRPGATRPSTQEGPTRRGRSKDTMQAKRLGFSAPSGTGKTTLLRGLIPLLKRQGLKVGVVKRSHHDFEIDRPGKDSHRLRQAGADETILISPHRLALIVERQPITDPTLDEATARLASQGLDLILVEGFHEAPIPKIELHRPAMGGRPRYPDDPWIIAIACDADPRPTPSIPRLDLNDPRSVARFIGRWLASGGEGRG